MSIIPESIQLATGACALNGLNELDFVIDGVMPIQWQRTYLSDNEHSGILGCGWSLPFTLFLLCNEQDVVFVDTQGREISFPLQEIGQSFYSKYERIALLRTDVQQWELITQDGVRLVFGVANAECETQEDSPRICDFNARGELKVPLASIFDSNGNELKLRYGPTGLLTLIERSDGLHLELTYGLSNVANEARLTEVHRVDGNASKSGHLADPDSVLLVSYRYSSQGDLEEVLDANGQVCQRFRYVDHQLVERHEATGLTAHYEWSEHSTRGQVVSMRHSTGVTWHFERDNTAHHVRVTQSNGALSRTIEQYFDEDGHIVRAVDAAGGIANWERDTYGNVLSYTDPEGHSTHYEYDQLGRTTMVALPDGARQTTQWFGNMDKPAAMTDGIGRTTSFEWDTRGNLLHTTEADGSTTSYRYDERGLPVTIIDALGKSKHLRYNTLGQLTEYIDCSSQSTRFSWDLEGNVLSITDALGQVTRHDYSYINRRRHLTYLRAADGSEERFAYDRAGRLIAYQDPLKQITRYQLDVGGNLQARTNALGNSLQYRYDGFGRLTLLVNENGADYRFAWDAQDRLVAERGFDGRRLDYRYNRIGHLLEMVDGLPQGAVWMGQAPTTIRTHYQRDAMGRMLERRAHKARRPSARTRLTYDAAGQLTMARNAQARVQLIYDAAGRISSEMLHTRQGQRSTLTHRYDLLGNRIATTLPDGRTVHTLTYGSGHVHQIHIDGEVICDFERDALHREIERTQGRLSSHYQLDPLGRLLASQTQERPDQKRPSPAQSATRLQAHNSTSGQTIARRYSYDAAGQLRNIHDSRTGLTTYHYDAIGRLTQAMANHATERFAFDPAHNLIAPGQQPKKNQQDSAAASTDDQETTDERWAHFVRENLANPDFNLLQQGAVAPEAAPGPEEWGQVTDNRLKVWQEHRYQYDTWGNCIQKKSGKHQVQHYTWDAEHQLVAVRTENQGQQAHWCYAYDPFGRRIAKWQVPSATSKTRKRREAQKLTHFTWDGNRLLAEYGQASPAQTKAVTALPTKHRLYLYEPESFVPLAQIESLWNPEEEPADKLSSNSFLQEVMQQARNDERFWNEKVLPLQRKLRSKLKSLDESPTPLQSRTYYVHTDHLGTPRELTNNTGDIVWSASYKAWGSTASIELPPTQQAVQVGNTVQTQWVQPLPEEAPEQNLRFQGQYFDAETGLHYNRFRYYDPDSGRFVSQDPIGLLGGQNSYQYAPNPMGWIDPQGLNRFTKTTWGPCNNGTKIKYTVYQQKIDWDLVVNGKTNLERAAAGGAPFIEKNGIPQQVQLHHSRQQSIGPLFEVTTSTHRAKKGQGREAMHPYGNSKNPDFPVDREAFEKDKDRYWRDRAKDEKNRRNGGCK